MASPRPEPERGRASVKKIWHRLAIRERHPRIWNGVLLFVLPGAFYFLSAFGLVFWEYEISHVVPLIWGMHAVAGLTGILYFAVSTILKRCRRNALLASIQVFLLFSAFPYVLFLAFAVSDRWLEIKLTPIGTSTFCFSAVLPELLWIIALASLKKRSRVPAVAFALLAAVVTLELSPMRVHFLFPGARTMMRRFGDTSIMRSFGKPDRENEFMRSLETLGSLAVASATLPCDRLTCMEIGLPLLDRNPDILKLNSCSPETHGDVASDFEWYRCSLDTALDSDADGLSDFQEAEILSNPSLNDTDGDGILDGEDSDPVNPIVSSRYAEINAAILEHFARYLSFPFFVVDNRFYKARGEIANFGRHVVLLEHDQVLKWNLIFGGQYYKLFVRDQFGLYVQIGRTMLDPAGRLAVVEVIQHHGIGQDSSGLVFLLVRHQGRWRVAAVNVVWI